MPQAALTMAAQRKEAEVVKLMNQRKPLTARKLVRLPTNPPRALRWPLSSLRR